MVHQLSSGRDMVKTHPN